MEILKHVAHQFFMDFLIEIFFRDVHAVYMHETYVNRTYVTVVRLRQ
jgi:hypothetical protein